LFLTRRHDCPRGARANGAKGKEALEVLPERRLAFMRHVGPYERLGETYAYLCGQWAPRNGRELRSAPALEEYLNDPRRTEPDALRTRIFLPLEPRAR
jgi:AraC family transcriptional regulator